MRCNELVEDVEPRGLRACSLGMLRQRNQALRHLRVLHIAASEESDAFRVFNQDVVRLPQLSLQREFLSFRLAKVGDQRGRVHHNRSR